MEALIFGFIIFLAISAAVKAPGQSLGGKFKRLGDLRGRTKEEIVAKVGPPRAVSATATGGQVVQWMATGYHIALLFGPDGRCLGISHEFAS